MSEEKMRILFSCVGASDPVRGNRDGAMLHIVRKYRPDKICLFISEKMRRLAEKDDRYIKAINQVKEMYPDYKPEILDPLYDDHEDVSDFDIFYKPVSAALDKLIEKYPGGEILVNLSSGTPQMKMTFAMLASEARYKLKAIQVKNPCTRGVFAQSTDSENYQLDHELENNKDNCANFKDRSLEPELFLVEHDKHINQIKTLLKCYDYEALRMLLSFTDEFKSLNRLDDLIEHLASRASYDRFNAVNSAVRSDELFTLYPSKFVDENSKSYIVSKFENYSKSVKEGTRDGISGSLSKEDAEFFDYLDISEFILTLSLMQKTGKFTDFVIRLNPLVIELQKVYLKRLLEKQSIKTIKLFTEKNRFAKRSELKSNKQLVDFLDNSFNRKYKQNFGGNYYVNIEKLNVLIQDAEELNGDHKLNEDVCLFLLLQQLNEKLRNAVAHNLNNITEKDIENNFNGGSKEVINRIIALLEKLFPKYYKKELFGIFDTANKWILEVL